jgi:hypothetical protein
MIIDLAEPFFHRHPNHARRGAEFGRNLIEAFFNPHGPKHADHLARVKGDVRLLEFKLRHYRKDKQGAKKLPEQHVKAALLDARCELIDLSRRNRLLQKRCTDKFAALVARLIRLWAPY